MCLIGNAKASMMKMKEKTIPLKMLKISLSLKSFIVFLRTVTLIIPFFILQAQEPQIFMLEDIYNNSMQKFVAQHNIGIMCKPYGVRTLEEILGSSKTSKSCRKILQNFYENNPKASYFVHTVMFAKAFYHVASKADGRCIVSVKGLRSYSEMLLYNGLAVVQKPFYDKEYLYRFKKVAHMAKSQKRGFYSDKVLAQCVLSNY